MYADYAQVQGFLTFLIEAIAILGFGGCIAHSILKHHLKLSKIYQEVPMSQQPIISETSAPEVIAPEVTDTVETELPIVPVEETPIPVLEQVPVTEPTLAELLSGIDIDNLKIRSARKLASMLKIKQKVNGKDQPLSWLRAQIKKSLQDNPQLVPKAIEIVHKTAA